MNTRINRKLVPLAWGMSLLTLLVALFILSLDNKAWYHYAIALLQVVIAAGAFVFHPYAYTWGASLAIVGIFSGFNRMVGLEDFTLATIAGLLAIAVGFLILRANLYTATEESESS